MSEVKPAQTLTFRYSTPGCWTLHVSFENAYNRSVIYDKHRNIVGFGVYKGECSFPYGFSGRMSAATLLVWATCAAIEMQQDFEKAGQFNFLGGAFLEPVIDALNEIAYKDGVRQSQTKEAV